MATNYKELPAWKKGVELAKAVYEATKDFPLDELEGLTLQMRRTAILIPCKIASGYAVPSHEWLRNRLTRADGLAAELETLAIAAHQLGFYSEDQKSDLVALILTELRLINGLLVKLENRTK